MDGYQLPDAKGNTALMRHILGVGEAERQQRREEILSTRKEQFREFAEALGPPQIVLPVFADFPLLPPPPLVPHPSSLRIHFLFRLRRPLLSSSLLFSQTSASQAGAEAFPIQNTKMASHTRSVTLAQYRMPS